MIEINNLTIIIPAHNRHNCLHRLIDYFKAESNVSILVCDSTLSPYPFKLPKDVKYLHFPDMSFVLKMHLSFQQINTDFVVMCAQDDFISPNALQKCILFLEKNLEYSSAQGETISFIEGDSKCLSFPSRLYSLGGAIDGNTVEERLEQCFKYYKDLFYTVYRVKDLSGFFSDIQHLPAGFNGFLIEVMMAFYCIINGKNKSLKMFYSAREYSQSSWAHRIPDLSTINNSYKGSQEFDQAKKICENYLSKLHPELKSPFLINKVFSNGVIFFKNLRGRKFSIYKSKAFRFIKPMISINVEGFLRNLFRAPFPFETYEKRIKDLPYQEGFPYGGDEEAKAEWDKIRMYIERSQCE